MRLWGFAVVGGVGEGIELTVNDDIVVMREINPFGSNQFRSLQ